MEVGQTLKQNYSMVCFNPQDKCFLLVVLTDIEGVWGGGHLGSGEAIANAIPNFFYLANKTRGGFHEEFTRPNLGIAVRF